jgi:histidyl-tRNA synthetase
MLDSKVPAPGIGFSIGEDRLVMAVENSLSEPALDVFIAPLGDAALRHAGVVARDLRRNGISVELATEGKLKRAMELANKLGARYTLIIGDNEIAAGQYALKNMQTGEQKSVTKDEICNQVSH